MDIAQLAAVLTQLGLAAAAWRLANKIDKRQEAHEKQDVQFQADVKLLLAAQDAEQMKRLATDQEFQDTVRARLGLAGA